MNTVNPPQLVCRKLSGLNLENWDAIAASFREAEVCELRHSWPAERAKDYRPARARTGWTDDALVVYAELEDRSIFNPRTKLNELSYETGDVFEMFLRPSGQDPYFEFHVSPVNQKLQLRIPSAAEFRAVAAKRQGLPDSWKIYSRVIESRVKLCPEIEKWFAIAVIPFDLVMEVEKPKAGMRWRFSFSRYDYTQGNPKPVLSSSSPHQKLDFHRQEEWGTLVFEG